MEKMEFEKHHKEVAERHAMLLGKIAMNWNTIQELYGMVFSELVGDENFGLAIWHAISNDRAARYVLEAAAKHKRGEESKFFKELQWALNQTRRFEDERDTALHSPYAMQKGEDGNLKFIPGAILGHQRAKKLEGKYLEAELTGFLENTSNLIMFIKGVQNNMAAKDDAPTWPERPRLPRVAHPQPHTEPRQKNTDK